MNLRFGPEKVGSRYTYALNVDFVTCTYVHGIYKQFRLGGSPDYSSVGIADESELSEEIRRVVFSAISGFKKANSDEYAEDELENIVFE